MSAFILVLSIISFIVGALIIGNASTAFIEIEGVMFLIISSILFTGAIIIDSISKIKKV